MDKENKKPVTAYELAVLMTNLNLKDRGMFIYIHPVVDDKGNYWLMLEQDGLAIDDLRLNKDSSSEEVSGWLESIINDLDEEEKAVSEHINDLMKGNKYV